VLDLPKLLNQRYEIYETLLAGSESQVYKGFDTRKKLPVLIKAYAPALLKDWKRFQLVEREAQTLAQLDHIQIPYFVDFFTLGAGRDLSLFLVTEFIKGQSLAEKLSAGWQPSSAEVFGLAEQLLQILIYLQAFQPPIIHRDIKPANLILTPFNRLYLVDFGGVQAVLHGQGAGGSTLVGTVGYMAPEQLMGQALPASDLYSLGMTVLQLLSAQSPESLPSRIDLAGIQALLPDLKAEIHDWLFHLLADDLSYRYESAQTALQVFDLLNDKDPEVRLHVLPEQKTNRLPEILHELQLQTGQDDSQALPAGFVLQGHYLLERCLGAGTHSWVYAAQLQSKPGTLIVKELRLAKLEKWKNLELFEREIDIQKALRHPKIPRFVDSFRLETEQSLSCFLVTERIPGETLEDKLNKGWHPTQTQVWDLAKQVLEILCYLNESKLPVVHRDLKPSNLILNEQGEVFLIDFGAVQNRLLSQGGGGSTIIGTFGYMAPEQFAGEASAQTDLYGLGATLLRLLSGRYPVEIPFEGNGLDFRDFVSVEDFYLYWLEYCLKPLPQERFDSPRQALELLVDYMQAGKTAARWLESKSQMQAGTLRGQPRYQLYNLIPPALALDKLPRYFKQSEFELHEQPGEIEIQLPAAVPLMQAGLKQLNQMDLFFWIGIGGLIALMPLVFATLILLPVEGLAKILGEFEDPYSVVNQLKPLAYLGGLGVLALISALGYGFRYGQKVRQGRCLPWRNSYFNLLMPQARFKLQPDKLSLLNAADPDPLVLALKWNKIKGMEWQPCRADYPHWQQFGPARPYLLTFHFSDYLVLKKAYSSKNYASYNLTLLLSEEGQSLLAKTLDALRKKYGQT